MLNDCSSDHHSPYLAHNSSLPVCSKAGSSSLSEYWVSAASLYLSQLLTLAAVSWLLRLDPPTRHATSDPMPSAPVLSSSPSPLSCFLARCAARRIHLGMPRHPLLKRGYRCAQRQKYCTPRYRTRRWPVGGVQERTRRRRKFHWHRLEALLVGMCRGREKRSCKSVDMSS